MNRQETFGDIVRNLRRQRQLKLVAVSRYLASSTLNAVENNRMVPSIALVDRIVEAFNLPKGSLDLDLLRTVHEIPQRTRLVERLNANPDVSDLNIQRVLRTVSHDARQVATQRAHAQFLLAQKMAARGARLRAIVLLQHLANGKPSLRNNILRTDISSTLGKLYLQCGMPQKALSPLLEAVRSTSQTNAWEAAMCNLGLVWWQLGQYDRAERQWHLAADQLRSLTRRAHATFGIGNLAFRSNDLSTAITAYRQAVHLYETDGADQTLQLRVLNNLMLCYVRLEDDDATEEVFQRGSALLHVEPVIFGAWLATRAEWAWSQNRRDEAQQLNTEAQEAIGSALVMSWFTTRLLDLQLSLYDQVEMEALIETFDHQVDRLNDRSLATGLQVAMAKVLYAIGHGETVQARLEALEALHPLIG